MVKFHKSIILISVITFIVFGFCDSLFFGIFLNDGLAKLFNKIGLRPNNSDIMVGSLASSVAIFISSYIKNYNKKIFGEVIDNPIIDIAGIIIGTYLYIVIVREYDTQHILKI